MPAAPPGRTPFLQRPYIRVALTGIALCAFFFSRAYDRMIQGVYGAGERAFGLTGVAAPTPSWPESTLDQALASWSVADGGFESVVQLSLFALAADGVFAIALALLLVSLVPAEAGLWVRRYAVVFALADLTENLVLAATIAHGLQGGRATHLPAADGVEVAIELLAVIKFAGLIAAIGAVVKVHSGDVPIRHRLRSAAVGASRASIPAGVTVVLVLTLLVFGTTAEQTADVLIGLDMRDPQTGAALAGAAGLCATLFVCGRWQSRVSAAAPTGLPRWAWWAGAVAGAGLLALGVVLHLLFRDWLGLAAVGVMVLALTLVGRAVGPSASPAPLTGSARVTRWTIAVATGAPLIVGGLALMEAALTPMAVAGTSDTWPLVVLAIAVQAAGWLLTLLAAGHLATVASAAPAGPGGWAEPVALSAIVLTLVVAVALPFATQPVAAGHALGPLAVLEVFLASLVMALTAVTAITDRLPAPRALAKAGFRNTPVVALGAVALLLASTLDGEGARYDARVQEGTWAGPQRSFGADVDARLAALAAGVPPGGGTGVPVFMISASGGGSRAAYWTARVLDCLVRDPAACGAPASTPPLDPANVLLVSSVSGGSLGLASYLAEITRNAGARGAGDPEAGLSDTWVRDRVAGDHLGPVLAAALFRDVPLALVRSDDVNDRSVALESSWEDEWADLGDANPMAAGVRALQAAVPDLPLVFMNGTTVQGGCRFNISVYDLGAEPARPPGASAQGGCRDTGPARAAGGADDEPVLPVTEDLADVICPVDDVRLSTAAVLSARFPFVSPSGGFRDHCAPATASAPRVNVVDGGYADNSGAGTVVDLALAVRRRVDRHNATTSATTDGPRCLVPVYVHIDSGYLGPAPGDGRVGELSAPLATYGVVRTRIQDEALQRLLAAFALPLDGVAPAPAGGSRAAVVQPVAGPGAEAPTGWELSASSQRELDGQLEKSAGLGTVWTWLERGFFCTPPPG